MPSVIHENPVRPAAQTRSACRLTLAAASGRLLSLSRSLGIEELGSGLRSSCCPHDPASLPPLLSQASDTPAPGAPSPSFSLGSLRGLQQPGVGELCVLGL